jgi:hypothetical protein
MSTAEEQEKERATYARGLAQGALGGRDGEQAVEDAVTELVINLLTIHERTIAAKNALLKENAQLRDQLAGNTRELPPGSTLDDQLEQVAAMAREVLKRSGSGGRLRSLAFLWEEGRAIVLHAQEAPAPLIQVATSFS